MGKALPTVSSMNSKMKNMGTSTHQIQDLAARGTQMSCREKSVYDLKLVIKNGKQSGDLVNDDNAEMFTTLTKEISSKMSKVRVSCALGNASMSSNVDLEEVD